MLELIRGRGDRGTGLTYGRVVRQVLYQFFQYRREDERRLRAQEDSE